VKSSPDFAKMAQKVVHFRTLKCRALPSLKIPTTNQNHGLGEFINQTGHSQGIFGGLLSSFVCYCMCGTQLAD
jgi:hypothetical protein